MKHKLFLSFFLLLLFCGCSSPVYHAVYRSRTTPSAFYPNMLPIKGGMIDSTYIPGYKNVGSYFMSQFEITNAQYAFFLNHLRDSSWFNRNTVHYFITLDSVNGNIYFNSDNKIVVREHYENHPVTGVTFRGAEYYTEWLTHQLQPHFQQDRYSYIRNVIYRLPLQIEWLYSASDGGNVTPAQKYYGSAHTDEVAWYKENTTTTQPAGLKKPNAFNFYDMNGNAYEWCVVPHFYAKNWDYSPTASWGHTPDASAICGGSYLSDENQLGIFSAVKYNGTPQRSDVGFRIAQNYLNKH